RSACRRIRWKSGVSGPRRGASCTSPISCARGVTSASTSQGVPARWRAKNAAGATAWTGATRPERPRSRIVLPPLACFGPRTSRGARFSSWPMSPAASPFRGGLATARVLLRDRFGHPALRIHQLKVIGPLLAGRSVLAVLPTGAGKSLCYQLPALMAPGLTLVVSPLISLMQDQVAALRRRGIAAAFLNSLLAPDQRRTILEAALSGQLTLLYCAPERLGSLVHRLARAGREVSLLAVDEAHCIVEWGNEFRPAYRRLDRVRYLLGEPVTIALTGSATPASRADILQFLRIPRAEVVVTSFDRPNLVFRVERVRDDRARFGRIRQLIRGAGGPVIVYTPTRRLTELVTRALLRLGVPTAPYHAGLTAGTRRR